MPPASLAGKIQRGLGTGFLEALERPRREVESIVLDCIAHDPRINQQDEDRDLYYARLMLALEMEESPVAAILARDPVADGTTTRDWLPLGVLGLLARTGRPVAIATLRDYVARGAWWSEAVRHLTEAGDPVLLDGLDALLAARFASDASDFAMEAGPPDEEPWRSWASRGPLAPLLAAVREGVADPEPIEFATLDSQALLPRVVSAGRRNDPATDVLVSRIRGGSAADRLVVEQALRGGDREMAARAVRVLGTLGDPAIVPVGERLLQEIGGGFAVPGSRLRPIILRGFEGLPPEPALEVARRWRDTDDYRGLVATNLLAMHATGDDVSWTVEAIRRAAASGDDLYAYARILRRFPGAGPFGGFEEIYRTYVPTCCRGHLLAAMSIADPTFGDTLAWECLWDCEAITREAAAGTVALTPAAQRRLRELALDPLEEDEVSAAAQARTA